MYKLKETAVYLYNYIVTVYKILSVIKVYVNNIIIIINFITIIIGL